MNLRPRYSLRTLMIVVTIVAVGVWAAKIVYDRHQRFKGRHFNYAFWAHPNTRVRGRVTTPETRQYWSELAEKYRQAARYPWLPVEPDPPPPAKFWKYGGSLPPPPAPE